VTALELRLLPVAEVAAGVLFFPIERASEVLNAWLAWTKDVPEEVTSCGRIMPLPPFPDVPEALRGNAFALVEIVVTGDLARADELVAPLRALGPALDTVRVMPARELSPPHMDPPAPVSGVGDGRLLGSADAAKPWDSGRDYMNFRESRSTGARLFSAEIHERLRAIKRRADPLDVIRSNHPVRPTTAPTKASSS
jgi:hypothetical protein